MIMFTVQKIRLCHTFFIIIEITIATTQCQHLNVCLSRKWFHVFSSSLGYDDGHYYTHLGSGSSPDDLRVKLEKRCVREYHVCMYV